MIPTLIFAGILVGAATIRIGLLGAIVLLGIGWASLVAFTVDADFFGGLAFGLPNAAVGVVFGAGLRAIGTAFTRREAGR